MDQFEKLKQAVENLYYAAYWQPDRECDAESLWKAVRDAAGLPPGQSFERLGPPRSVVSPDSAAT